LICGKTQSGGFSMQAARFGGEYTRENRENCRKDERSNGGQGFDNVLVVSGLLANDYNRGRVIINGSVVILIYACGIVPITALRIKKDQADYNKTNKSG
jgi:hypothetical protein